MNKLEDLKKVYVNLYKKLQPKYFLERISACFLLFMLLPLIFLGILAIKLDSLFNPKNSGSIFYTEQRVSAGKIFKIIKFRTVTQEALRWIRKDLENRSITASGPQTKAGKVILNWYLDELPQLFNIIKGDMSFIGPRPHIKKQYQQEIRSGLIYRGFIKAGFFGVPQACKRHPQYRGLLEKMAKTHKPNIELLNTLDGLYIKKCLTLPLWKLFFFDFWVFSHCVVVILRGGAKY